MNTRERFLSIMNFRPFDRLPILEWAVWRDKTVERWHSEGLPESVTDQYEICRHFELDVYKQDWFNVYQSGGSLRPSTQGGGVMETESDYAAVRKCLYPACAVDRERWEQWAREQQRGDVVLWFNVEGFFWLPDFHYYALADDISVLLSKRCRWMASNLHQNHELDTGQLVFAGIP